MKKTLQIFIVFFFGLIFLTSCAQKVGVTKIGISERFRQLTKSIFDLQYPSERTIMFLAQNDLLDSWKKDSLSTLKDLDRKEIENTDRETLFALAELCFYEAEQMKEQSKEVMPLYLSATVYAYNYLFGKGSDELSPYHPNSRLTCQIYNRSLAELLTYAEKNKIKLDENVKFPMLNGEIILDQRLSELSWEMNEFEEIKIVYEFKVEGIEFQFRTYGVGVPIIATRKSSEVEKNKAKDKTTPIINQTHAATAFLRIKSREISKDNSNVIYKADIELYDPITTEKIIIGENTVPLETDFTTPLAYLVSKDTSPSGFRAMLNVGVWDNFKGLYLLQPYQCGKIPIVFIHGLMSQPKTWLKILNTLKSDPEIRKNYQFWFFRYPTGNPLLYSAGNLRQSLIDARKAFDPKETDEAFDKMVLVAHSMGGLLSRFMIQDSSNLLWNIVSDTPIKECELKPSTRELAEQLFFFEPLPFVSRVVFISTPHRGSTMANSWYAKFGAFITRLPKKLTDTTSELAPLKSKKNHNEKLSYNLKRIPSGIEALLPTNPTLKIMDNQPFKSNVIYHSIIGNKKEANVTGGTDGIVTYESAHLEGAESEKIVHSNHGAHTKPSAIFEVQRILKKHLKE